MKVRIVYRNYKPLHQLYYSLLNYPPEGIEYSVSDPIKIPNIGYKLYLYLGSNGLIKRFITNIQSILFNTSTNDSFDLIHYIQILPSRPPKIPYVIDIEHAISLTNFLKPSNLEMKSISTRIKQESRKIICLSFAAKQSLHDALGREFENISSKVEVVYPSLPLFKKNLACDYSLINKGDEKVFKILFVGNSVERKGLEELLIAFKIVKRTYSNLALYVVSNANIKIVDKYKSKSIHFYEPVFTKNDIIQKLFLHMDLFVLPTKQDTFGMALLDALSSGVPVLTTGQFAASEIVREGINGFLLKSDRLVFNNNLMSNIEDVNKYQSLEPEPKLINSIVDKVLLLYEDRELLNMLKDNSIKDFQPGGKFSIETRNTKLKKIYENALK